MAIAIVCEAFIIFTTFRFLKRFGFKKKVFALFLIWINWSLVWRIIYIIVLVFNNRPGHCDNQPYCEEHILDTMNLTFLVLAGTINIYNWFHFTLTLRVYDQGKKKTNKFWLHILNICTPILWIIVFLIYLSYFTVSWSSHFTDGQHLTLDNIINWITIGLFLLLGVAFIIASWHLRRELWLWNEEVAKKATKKIIFAAYIMIVPFFFRVIFNILNMIIQINDDLDRSISKNTWLAPFIYFTYILITDIVPMTAQISSMLVVINQDDFSQGLKESIGESQEGNFLTVIIYRELWVLKAIKPRIRREYGQAETRERVIWLNLLIQISTGVFLFHILFNSFPNRRTMTEGNRQRRLTSYDSAFDFKVDTKENNENSSSSS